MYRNKSYDKSAMAHMTLYALRQKFNLQTEADLRFCKCDFCLRALDVILCYNTLLSDCFLIFEMIIDMGNRRAGKQNRPSLIFEAPPPPHTHTPNSQKIFKT